MKKRLNNKQGFTLVEIALAMMVATMGLLVVMGLFVDGLATQQVTVDDTQTALFAEDVLQSYRALASEDWNGVDSVPLPPVAWDLWDMSKTDPVRVSNLIQTNRYVVRGSEVEEFAVRYKLDVEDIANSNRKRVRLEVWNGEVGSLDDSRVFYTELFNTKYD